MDGVTRSLLDRLARVPARQRELDREEHALVRELRGRGTSWATVATALGLGSRQAAEQRASRLDARLRDGTVAPAGPDDGDPGGDPGVDAAQDVAVPELPPAAGAGSRSSETRRRLVDAAALVLAERGYASTRISDVADRAQLRAGSVYHHFRSKDALIEEVLRHGVLSTHRGVAGAVAGLPPSAGPAEQLEAAMRAHLRSVLSLDVVARAHVHVFDQLPAAMKERIRPLRRAYGALWSELVGRAVEAGELRADVGRYVVRLFVVNSVEAVSLWAWRTHLPADELAATVGRLVLDGVVARPESGSGPATMRDRGV